MVCLLHRATIIILLYSVPLTHANITYVKYVHYTLVSKIKCTCLQGYHIRSLRSSAVHTSAASFRSL